MLKTIIINGSGGVGKDTFVGLCKELITPKLVFNISTVDVIKIAASELGWNEESKTEKDRKFLSDLKDLCEEYNNGPTNYIINKFKYFKKIESRGFNVIVFVHCREPERIEFLKNELNATTLLITRPDTAAITTNHADRDVQNYQYDYTVTNDGTLEDLKDKARTFLFLIGCN